MMITKRLLLFLLLTATTLATQAQPTLHRLIVDATLYDNYITIVEVRDVAAGNADEMYVSYNAQVALSKVIMKVSERGDNNDYEQVDKWNTALPSAEKARHCGYTLTHDGKIELHWGMIPQSRKQYFVSYGIRNAMYATADADVLDYPFINLPDDMPAEKMELRIHLSGRKITTDMLNLDDCVADGKLTIEDGTLYIRPEKGNTRLNYQLKFKKGLFPNLPAQGSFATSDLQGGSFTPSELQSPMMLEKTPKTELGFYNLWNLCLEYPITAILIFFTALYLLFLLIKYAYMFIS
jgi:hypothetical protein